MSLVSPTSHIFRHSDLAVTNLGAAASQERDLAVTNLGFFAGRACSPVEGHQGCGSVQANDGGPGGGQGEGAPAL
jgi:hypothetical protein